MKSVNWYRRSWLLKIILSLALVAILIGGAERYFSYFGSEPSMKFESHCQKVSEEVAFKSKLFTFFYFGGLFVHRSGTF